MIDKTPQVFISYSWTSNEYQERVIQLATKMRRDGIDVKLDVWDLKDGQDKYVFMEQCVTNPEIDKVLILSDKRYAEKANERRGGVGDETTIISAEIYGHAVQSKFIPVVMERSPSGEVFLPAYLKSRLYRDLSGQNYENEYRELLRTIYDEPSHQKPEIGKRPNWLTAEVPGALFPLKDAVDRIGEAKSEKKALMCARAFIDNYSEAIKPFFKRNATKDEYLADFVSIKDYRNIFLDHLEPLAELEGFGGIIADEFEKLYNTLYSIKFFNLNAYRSDEIEFDIFRVHIWELFVCTITFMLHHEMYTEMGEILRHTYFLRRSASDDSKEPTSYSRFRYHSHMLEDIIKPTLDGDLNRKYTLLGHYLCNEREYLPVFSGKAVASGDLFLFQVSNCLRIKDVLEFDHIWFPTCYIYAIRNDSIWKKLVSKRFCERIMPLFGVSSISELKLRISEGSTERSIGYPYSWETAPQISAVINLEEIGKLP